MDQKQFHSTEMDEWWKDSEKILQRRTDSIARNITEGIREYESRSSSACIYRVPEELRKQKESAYTPRLIAIGPLHRDDEHLRTSLQHVKLSYANDLFCRVTEAIKDTKSVEDTKSAEEKMFPKLKECVQEMIPLIADATKCYAGEVTLDEKMLLVDGCFILELLYRYKTQALQTELPLGVQDQIKSSSEKNMADTTLDGIFTANIVRSDLLLLENQIPYLVLQKLFSLTIDKIPNRSDKITLDNLIREYFGIVMNPKQKINFFSPRELRLWVFRKMKNRREDGVASSLNCYHILHKLHQDYRPRHETKTTDIKELMPSASNLFYATIKFVPSTEKDLLKVKFSEPKGLFRWISCARFEITPLGIGHTTETFLRNMVAFEQSHHEVSKHFTSYAYLMDMLVNSEKDVEVLEKAGVTHNYLFAKDDVIDLFNKLSKETILGEFCFAEACNKAIEHSKRCWPNFIAHWKRRYYEDKWQFIAIYLSFVSLFASIAQVVIALMSLK